MANRLRLLLRAALWGVGGLTLLVGLGIAYILLFHPKIEPPSDIVIRGTADQVERGRYLVEHVAYCLDCHSERDWSRYAGPIVAATKGQGARLDFLDLDIWSANITPAAIGEWSDGEVMRAITSGIKPDESALHPMMPYDSYARLTESDLHGVVAYLRTLPSITHEPPEIQASLPIRLISRLLPTPYRPPVPPDPQDSVARGRYLTAIAECGFCHREDFSGGKSFSVPGGDAVVSENISNAPGTLFAEWDRENFIGLFRAFAGEAAPVEPGGVNTVMPWTRYAGMSEDDLGAIYDYLRTVEPGP